MTAKGLKEKFPDKKTFFPGMVYFPGEALLNPVNFRNQTKNSHVSQKNDFTYL
jgi:hypothetical protein